MHIAAAAPEYVSKDEVSEDAIERELRCNSNASSRGQARAHRGEIVAGRMGKYYEEVCLLEQKFVKDDKKTVGELLTDSVAKIGENIKVRRFTRFVLGEGLEKRSDDFAAEVAAQIG